MMFDFSKLDSSHRDDGRKLTVEECSVLTAKEIAGSTRAKEFTLERAPAQPGLARWYFRCGCGRRVTKLYRPPSQKHYACRHCHRLTYMSSQTSHCFDGMAKKMMIGRHDLAEYFRNNPDHLRMMRELIQRREEKQLQQKQRQWKKQKQKRRYRQKTMPGDLRKFMPWSRE